MSLGVVRTEPRFVLVRDLIVAVLVAVLFLAGIYLVSGNSDRAGAVFSAVPPIWFVYQVARIMGVTKWYVCVTTGARVIAVPKRLWQATIVPERTEYFTMAEVTLDGERLAAPTPDGGVRRMTVDMPQVMNKKMLTGFSKSEFLAGFSKTPS